MAVAVASLQDCTSMNVEKLSSGNNQASFYPNDDSHKYAERTDDRKEDHHLWLRVRKYHALFLIDNSVKSIGRGI